MEASPNALVGGRRSAEERVKVKQERPEREGINVWSEQSLDQISTDFLQADVTGEVMNLDDFLKELQNNDQPSNINAPRPAPRISVLQSVGRAPELKKKQFSSPVISPEDTKPPIPQASVRPQQREVMMPVRGKKIPVATVVREQAATGVNVKTEKMQLNNLERYSDDDEGGGNEDESSSSHNTSNLQLKFSADDLRLATIPGHEGEFDPSTRRFSEDELKPQPIIRKRRKQFVPDELKNTKYWAKRCTNNEAAKRSREARRLKENQIAMRARYLEEENNVLKAEVEELKKENGELRRSMQNLEEKINDLAASRRLQLQS